MASLAQAEVTVEAVEQAVAADLVAAEASA
jgi:hypothetical protein